MSSETPKPSPLRRFAVAVARKISRVVQMVLQPLRSSTLDELRRDTEQLASASVESVTYVGSEMQQLGERVSHLEGEMAAIRRLLELEAGNR